jgi:hypothetical protein
MECTFHNQNENFGQRHYGSNYWNHVTLHLLIILKFQLYKYIILHYSLRTQLHHEWIHNLIFRPRKSQSSIIQVSCFKSVVWRVLSYVGELCTDLFFLMLIDAFNFSWKIKRFQWKQAFHSCCLFPL